MAAPRRSKWDVPTVVTSDDGPPTKSEWDSDISFKRRKWDNTPLEADNNNNTEETPRKNLWDATPLATSTSEFTIPSDIRSARLPSSKLVLITSDQLDEILPSEGYTVIDVEIESFIPTAANIPEFKIANDAQPTFGSFGSSELPMYKPEDFQFFGSLLEPIDENSASLSDLKDRKILQLLLKVKNGDPPSRKHATRMIIERARELGSNALLTKVLDFLMVPSLEDHERHLIVKILDRILGSLGEMVRPHVPQVLATLHPLLINENFFIRAEGKEIIANLTKSAGLPCMIAALRPDIDHADENIRNNTCRTFGIIASTLGIRSILPFLKAVCSSKKSWQARHSAMKIVQQISISMGCSILPDLRELVECVAVGLNDEQHRTRTMAALAASALAEASYPYGSDSLSPVFDPILNGVRHNRGKPLAAFIKACGFIILLMDEGQAASTTREAMPAVVHEFRNSDEEMKRIILRFLVQVLGKVSLPISLIRDTILRDFIEFFWLPRIAGDKRLYKDVITISHLICKKVGVLECIPLFAPLMKDSSEPVRKLAVYTLEHVFDRIGISSIDSQLEARIFDGISIAFQEMQGQDSLFLVSIGNIFNHFGQRSRPYIVALSNLVLWRLTNRSASIRSNAAEIISYIAPVIFQCEEAILVRICVVLFENLGEEYPDVLANILKALKCILLQIGTTRTNPQISDILLRISPILRNRHEKVQESTVALVGLVAQKAPEAVSAREWMRISFELLELLRSPRRTVRRVSVLSFGYIAKAIGPHEVLSALLSNLKVQERQNRVCTTVAIAIVAEACSPFTVIPSLMNEYRVPELNVQNGVLKAFAFLFEYIGELAKDYIFAVTPLLEDALIERDLVHRQIAAAAVKHMVMGVVGFGCEEAMVHLLNLIWPNIFETSPHVISCVIEAIEAITLGLGPATIMQYAIQGLFHPARRVRDIYWRAYNNCYLASADALVSFYPRLVDSEKRHIRRDVFDLFI